MSRALEQAASELASHGIDNAGLEAEVLLRHTLQITRVELYSNLKRVIAPDQIALFLSLIKRRIQHEPTAYITGHREFFGLDLQVAPPVLIPRPETEILVETAIDFSRRYFPPNCLIADIGTGCGAIAIALAVNLRQARIYATDVSLAALDIAGNNCRRFGVDDRVVLLDGDLLEPLPEPVHLIAANLPYVSKEEQTELSPEIIGFEPLMALDGGVDGLRFIERLLLQVESYLLPRGVVLLEIGHDQGQSVCDMAREHFFDAEIAVVTDLGGLNRVVSIVTGV
ncbi:MAG: peptide chain release factor N(5)-glutamine methyltransferase [Dehalococcoidia bacterium]|nr:peptide chain release factor N(5)-glutamine methyltransferase [Dehalococcoidia bacterium]